MHKNVPYYNPCFILLVVVTLVVIIIKESEGSSDEEDTRDMEGKMYTDAGMEVIFFSFHLDVHGSTLQLNVI